MCDCPSDALLLLLNLLLVVFVPGGCVFFLAVVVPNVPDWCILVVLFSCRVLCAPGADQAGPHIALRNKDVPRTGDLGPWFLSEYCCWRG